MKTLQIEIPNGFEVKDFDMKTGKVTFKEKPKSPMELIKTVDDILADHQITEDKLDDMFSGVPEHFKYQYLAELLAESLNEGWKPDWNNSNETKYFPWFEMGGFSGFQFDVCGHWYSHSAVGSRLCYKSRELAEYAGKQFIDIYKQFMLIN